MPPPSNMSICRAFDSPYKAERMLGSREHGKDGSEHGTLADPPRKAARKERAESGSGFASFVFHTLAFLSSAELQEKKRKQKTNICALL